MINITQIENELYTAAHANHSIHLIKAIIDKGEHGLGLAPFEAAILLKNNDAAVTAEIFRAANALKEKIYGKRVVLFAPLYISDYCMNECSYCGYRCSNTASRCKLSQDEIVNEVRALEKMGHKRLALELGEDSEQAPLEYVLDSIKTIYATTTNNGIIRRVNVNIAATSINNYRKLKDANIGTYILFQETYHPEAYAYYHTSGPKADYSYHLAAMDRAMQAGLGDIGIGALFGLYDPDFEALALLYHAAHLENTYGIGPHTVSVPRLKPADGTTPPMFDVGDEHFAKIVAVLRLALPYTGLILSTREPAALRKQLLNVGISQISAGSQAAVGGYTNTSAVEQFSVSDIRSLDETVGWLCREGFIPSFCTECYSDGRVGDVFMALAKSGEINNYCTPNAMKTLQEYSENFATDTTKSAIMELRRTL